MGRYSHHRPLLAGWHLCESQKTYTGFDIILIAMGIQDLSIDRRSFLSGLVGSLGGTGLLQSASERALAGSSGGGEWSQPGGNAAHTARFDDGSGPTGNITKAWEASPGNFAGVAVIDGTVYTATNELTAIAATDGTDRWTFTPSIPTPEMGTQSSAFARIASPTVVDGVVYIPVSFGIQDANRYYHTALIAVDAATGTKRWRIDSSPPSFSAVAAADSTLFVAGPDLTGDGGEHVYALNPADGTVRWRQPGGGVPPVADGRAFTTEESGVTALDAATGEVVWTALPQVKNLFTELVSNGTLFVAEGTPPGATLIALDAATGTEQWRTAYDPTPSSYPSIGTVDDERVYVQMETMDADVIALDRTDGSERWKATIPQPTKTAGQQHVPVKGLARGGNLLYVGGAALQPTDGSPVWMYATPGSEPSGYLRAVAGGRAYLTVGRKLIVLRGTTDQPPQTLTVTRSQETSPTDMTPTDTTPTDTTPTDTTLTDTPPTGGTASTLDGSSPTATTTHDSGPGTPAEQTTSANGPGFGVLAALAGVGVGAWR